MTVLDVEGVAVLVASALEALNVEYTLGGSVASSAQGEPRSTNDIDFAVRLDAEHVPRLASALGPDFAVDEDALREAVMTGRSANIFHLPSMTKVDLFVRGARPFDRSEFSRRLRLTLQSGAGSLFVATREDNLLRKLMWFRLGGEVSDRQWRDILGLLRVGGTSLDAQYVEGWAHTLDVFDLLERARKP